MNYSELVWQHVLWAVVLLPSDRQKESWNGSSFPRKSAHSSFPPLWRGSFAEWLSSRLNCQRKHSFCPSLWHVEAFAVFCHRENIVRLSFFLEFPLQILAHLAGVRLPITDKMSTERPSKCFFVFVDCFFGNLRQLNNRRFGVAKNFDSCAYAKLAKYALVARLSRSLIEEFVCKTRLYPRWAKTRRSLWPPVILLRAVVKSKRKFFFTSLTESSLLLCIAFQGDGSFDSNRPMMGGER